MTGPVKPNVPKESLRANRILVLSLMTGIVFFTIIVVVVNMGGVPPLRNDAPMRSVFNYAVFGIAFFSLLSAFSIYNKKMTFIQNNSLSLTQRLDQYRAALITYMALCEGAAIFAIIVFFLTGNLIVLIVVPIVLIVMFRKIPFQKNVIRDLNLDWKDQEDLT
jgi:hypothetical protein